MTEIMGVEGVVTEREVGKKSTVAGGGELNYCSLINILFEPESNIHFIAYSRLITYIN